MNIAEAEERRPIFQNQPYPKIVPGAPAETDLPTYTDPAGRLEIFIDPEHGYLKGLRFPSLFGDALARSVDQYVISKAPTGSEFDYRVKNISVDTESVPPRIVVDCVNETVGLAITKRCALHADAHEDVKTVEIESASQQLLGIQSVTILSGAMRTGGYYYQYLAHTANRYCSYPAESIGTLRLPLINISANGTDDVTLKCRHVEGKSYTVHYSDAIPSGQANWQIAEENVPAALPGLLEWTDQGDIGSGRLPPNNPASGA